MDASNATDLAGGGANYGFQHNQVISDPNGNRLGIVKMGNNKDADRVRLQAANTYSGDSILLRGC